MTATQTATQWMARMGTHFTPEPNTGCWLWTRAATGRGYGAVRIRRQWTQAHRASWTALRGPIPSGLVIDHLCRTPLCVNPEHMRVVTQRENTLSGRWAHKTHCVNGHPLVGDNIVMHTRRGREPSRECRTCIAASVARRNK